MRNSDTAYNSYLESEILSADPIRLVELLYRGAIEAVQRTRERLRDNDIAGRAAASSKVSAIIDELNCSLDRERGGEIGEQLGRLYDYMQSRLIDGNVRQADEPFAEVERLLTTIYEGWKECVDASAPALDYVDAGSYAPLSCSF
jgi:flagellar protein FliS